MTLVFDALRWAGAELSRDDVGYLACHKLKTTRFYRERLDGDEALLLVRQAYDAWTNRLQPPGQRLAFPLPKGVIGDVMGLLRSRARELPITPHDRRVAVLPNGSVVIDLGRERDPSCIVLSAKGWRIAKHPPPGVRLIRGQGTLPLPEPIRPGRDGARRAIAELNELWPGIRGDRLIILLATLAWCLVSRHDHVAILLHGEYGAGKSSLARLVRGVLDPNRQPYQPLPTVDAARNLLIAGLHQRLVAVDNTSEEAFTRDIADGLCQRLDGYAGARFRSLQTNADLTVIPSSGPLLMTAITPLTRYPDLADRAVVVDAREIRAPRLINPSQLDERVARLIPALLGVLLEAAVAGLARAADFGVVEGWRNARFAAFAQAAARALGEPPAAMAACLADMGTYQRTLVASMAPVAAALIDLAGQEPEETETASLLPTGCVWRGRMTDLLAELAKNPALRMDSAFPRNPAALMGEILRLRPVLDTAGVRVAFRRANRRGKSPVGVARWVELWTEPELAPDQAGEGDEPHPEPMPSVRH